MHIFLQIKIDNYYNIIKRNIKFIIKGFWGFGEYYLFYLYGIPY